MALTRRTLLQRMGLIAPAVALAPGELARRVGGAKAEAGEPVTVTGPKAMAAAADARREDGIVSVFYMSDPSVPPYITVWDKDGNRRAVRAFTQ